MHDDKFKILDYGISQGTRHTIYKGNQTVGRVRAKLKYEVGLKFLGESPASGVGACESRAFLLRYRGDFPVEELKGLRAVLTNDKNVLIELGSIEMFPVDENTLVRCFLIPWLPASDDSFRIDFKLQSADEPVASCKIGRIYRHDKGIQSNPRTPGR